MLIVNSKQLPLNPPKGHELEEYSKEYQEKLKELQIRFPSGTIALIRNGYPKMNKGADGSPNMPEIPAPIFIKYTSTDTNGVSWSYCKGRPLIHPNGLVEVPPNDNSEMISDEVFSIDLRNKPDYAFYIMYKSKIVGTEYSVHDPEGDKLKELLEKNAKLKVQYSIREMGEEKLRMVASAWGVKGANEKNAVVLQEDLENLVFRMEEEKKKNPTNLMAKGVDEFLKEIKNDEVTRPKAIIQLGLDEKRITFKGQGSTYLFDGNKICFVPLTDKDRPEYLRKFLQKDENKEIWQTILRGLLNKEYIESLDKYGLRWLSGQLGLATNLKEDELRNALLEQFSAE